MKYLALVLILFSSSALAEVTGPYYISFPAYCDVYELYYEGNKITGTVYGCKEDEVPIEITGRITSFRTPVINQGRSSRLLETVKQKEINFIGDGIQYKDVLSSDGISVLYVGPDKVYLLGSQFTESTTKPTIETE